MPDPASKAVFLSYASQDAEAAKRICEALRAAGVEVWFDQDALVGGDAWDAKIRGQINSCALFIPVISAATQERLEGYFRLEWKLAANRSHTMAEEKTFLLPVVIDATRDAEGKVPTEFRAVQWTWLPAGETPTAFVVRVKNLLAGPSATTTAKIAEHVAMQTAAAPAPAKSGFPIGLVAALAVVLLGLVAFIALRPTATESIAASRPAKRVTETKAAAPVSSAAQQADAKSIAVLPFVNRSAEKADEFFTDGIHEDILTNLAHIRELHVVSRTSVMDYRGTAKKIPQIARELNVAYILEGSVQRAGNKVRVTGQLIRAATDEHVWAESYDRDLGDVFGIQSELAQKIASALQATLSPEEKKILDDRPTKNPAAYDLFLKARAISFGTAAAFREADALFQSAVALDPDFAKAWCNLSVARAVAYFNKFDHTPARLASAKAALDQAVRLAPDSRDTLSALGNYYYRGFRDYASALEYFERVSRLQPNDTQMLVNMALVMRRQGRWAESIPYVLRAAQLEPSVYFSARAPLNFLFTSRRYEEALNYARRLVALASDDLVANLSVASIAFSATGSKREMENFLTGLSPEKLNSRGAIAVRKFWAQTSGDFDEAIQLDRLQPYFDNLGASAEEQAIRAALVLAASGRRDEARARLEDFPAQLRARVALDPNDERLFTCLARMEMLLGNNTEALKFAQRAVELLPESKDAVDGPACSRALAMVYAWTGDKERALAELARLLHTAGGVEQNAYGVTNVHELRHGAEFFPLRGDPRFEALLNDPKNNAPLF